MLAHLWTRGPARLSHGGKVEGEKQEGGDTGVKRGKRNRSERERQNSTIGLTGCMACQTPDLCKHFQIFSLLLQVYVHIFGHMLIYAHRNWRSFSESQKKRERESVELGLLYGRKKREERREEGGALCSKKAAKTKTVNFNIYTHSALERGRNWKWVTVSQDSRREEKRKIESRGEEKTERQSESVEAS